MKNLFSLISPTSFSFQVSVPRKDENAAFGSSGFSLSVTDPAFLILNFCLFTYICLFTNIYLLIFLAALGLRRCLQDFSSCGVRGFSCCGAWAPGHSGFSNYGPRAYLLRGVWDPPGPGIEPMSSALAGGFLTTGPPGKSQFILSDKPKTQQALFQDFLFSPPTL